jgi:hypothetical protein
MHVPFSMLEMLVSKFDRKLEILDSFLSISLSKLFGSALADDEKYKLIKIFTHKSAAKSVSIVFVCLSNIFCPVHA